MHAGDDDERGAVGEALGEDVGQAPGPEPRDRRQAVGGHRLLPEISAVDQDDGDGGQCRGDHEHGDQTRPVDALG